jgi:hypothetical protein
MSDLENLKQDTLSYLNNLMSKKSDLFKTISLLFLSMYLTAKFIGAFDSSQGYDVRGEFCGYLLLMSFFNFLFINYKFNESKNLKLVSFIQLLLAIVNLLIIKSLSTLLLLKITVLFLAIFLFLALVREIKNRG